MELDFLAILAELLYLKLGTLFGFKLHIKFVPLCNVVLTLTDGTD